MHYFRRLEVWARPHYFARDVARLTARVRRVDDRITATQLRRSALAISSLICEGCGKRTRAETVRYLDIALGSATESERHLVQAMDLALLPHQECRKLISEAVQIQRMLHALMRNLPADPRYDP